MRVALAMILLLGGCAELEPDFSTSEWFDGVEENVPTGVGLYTDSASSLPGLWARSTAQANTGDSSWHFGDGVGYEAGMNASLLTPDFEAGRMSFLRFSYWSDVPTLSATSATDGAVVEVQVGTEEWVMLDLHGGYPYVLDEIVLGSRLFIGKGVLAGDDQQWHDEYVEFADAEPGDPIRFRFRFSTDIDPANNMGEGLYIDDVEFLIVE